MYGGQCRGIGGGVTDDRWSVVGGRWMSVTQSSKKPGAARGFGGAPEAWRRARQAAEPPNRPAGARQRAVVGAAGQTAEPPAEGRGARERIDAGQARQTAEPPERPA